MVANKLRAIWKLITSRQYLLIYDGSGPNTALGGGKTGELKDVMYLAVQVKHAYNTMIEMIEGSAVEAGEAHALKEMRDAIEIMEKKNGR